MPVIKRLRVFCYFAIIKLAYYLLFYMSSNKIYPVNLELSYPEKSSRWLALATILMFIKPLLLIPHFIVIYVYGVVGTIAFVAAQFAILFTGKYPKSLFCLVKSVTIWQLRVNSYFMALTDKYPPFDMGLNDEEQGFARKGLAWIIGIILGLILLAIVLANVNS